MGEEGRTAHRIIVKKKSLRFKLKKNEKTNGENRNQIKN